MVHTSGLEYLKDLSNFDKGQGENAAHKDWYIWERKQQASVEIERYLAVRGG